MVIEPNVGVQLWISGVERSLCYDILSHIYDVLSYRYIFRTQLTINQLLTFPIQILT